jgi:hypothetical protein
MDNYTGSTQQALKSLIVSWSVIGITAWEQGEK